MAPPPGPPPPNQPVYYQSPYYGGGSYYPAHPPPQYTANPQSYGYFGAQTSPPQQSGIELQSPPNAHTANASRTYPPPPGPPPAKA